MPALLSTHSIIEVVKTISGNTEETRTDNENAGQTFALGSPVMFATGNVQAWDGTTVTAGVAGVALEDAHNLATAGAGAPTAFTTVGFPGTGITFGRVPNQPAAVNIPEGAPFSLGMLTFAVANLDTIFRGQTDNNAGTATTPTAANIGTQYGLSVDANGRWYVDFGKTTVGTNTVVQMYSLDPIDGSVPNARILFMFTKSALQLHV